MTDYCSNCLSGVNRSQEHSWQRNLVLFLVDSCIPARQWTDICNTRCSILSRFSHFHVPQFHVSHFQRPRLQLPPQQGCCQFCCLVNRGTMGVNSLPKTVTRQRRDCDLNPGPSTLNTRLPSRPTARISTRNRKQCRVVAKTDTRQLHIPSFQFWRLPCPQ